VQGGSPGQIVGAQRRGQGLEQETGVGIEQDQQMGHGEATPRRLRPRLAKGFLQLGGVRHGEAGAVQQIGAVAVPAGGRTGVVGSAAVAGNGLSQSAEEGQGESGAGLAVSGVGEVQAAEMAEVADGGVAVQDLADEEIGGDGGAKGSSAEGVLQLAANAVNDGCGEGLGEIGLDAGEGLGDTEHRDLLGLMVSV
jgi:hypothetical protein